MSRFVSSTRLLIFDWDDTITRGGLELYTASYFDTLTHFGIAANYQETQEIVARLWGRPHQDVISALMIRFTGKDTHLHEAITFYRARLLSDEFLENVLTISGAVKTLRQLHENYLLAVASSGDPRVIRDHLIPRLKVEPLFRYVITAMDLPDPGRTKPYPDLAVTILKELDVRPEQALIIGDGEADYGMATSAGIPFVAVLTGQLTKERVAQLGIVNALPSIAQLPAFLESLNKYLA